jgi:hypothetical protein
LGRGFINTCLSGDESRRTELNSHSRTLRAGIRQQLPGG